MPRAVFINVVSLLTGASVFALLELLCASSAASQERAQAEFHPLPDMQQDILTDGAKPPSWQGGVPSGAWPAAPPNQSKELMATPHWLEQVHVGYEDGFVIAAPCNLDMQIEDLPFVLRLGGYGQLRHTNFDSHGPNPDVNQFQLTRARIVFSGHAFSPRFNYFVQLDGQSSSGDMMRLLDYFLTWDFGNRLWGLEPGTIGFKTGKYKIPFDLARYLSSKQSQFTDRSMASMYFDVNRSLAGGLYGRTRNLPIPWHWETAIFNGLVTGGAETGSSGTLDNNFAWSARIMGHPRGQWGPGELSDFTCHRKLATRIGAGTALTTIDRSGSTEFNQPTVVDSGVTLASILPASVNQYSVALFSVDASCKYRGASATIEIYFRTISDFQGATIPDLFDRGLWLQGGYFVIPGKLELLARWSRVAGNSGSLGVMQESSEELAGGAAWYFSGEHVKLTVDITNVQSAPINSPSLDMSPGDTGWLARTQIQFAF